ncbi:EAL domain-containing protein, partial [Myxococcota bacterium]|nr:EAL domain-containing protein [Myxococcota bacterium]
CVEPMRRLMVTWSLKPPPCVGPPACALPTLAGRATEILEAFDQQGVMGLLLLDSPGIAELERLDGAQARQESQKAFFETVANVALEGPRPQCVVLGELGRTEILVFWIRPAGSGDFYRLEIPQFARKVNQASQRSGRKPFFGSTSIEAGLWYGRAVAFRNPRSDGATQLRELIQAAREDAESSILQRKREERRLFTELLLDRRVSSVYEPIVEVGTHTVFGYEALVRGPRGTPLYSADSLFRAASTHDLVFELDALCRASGLRGAADFPSETKLFLNVMPSSLETIGDREGLLMEALQESGLTPRDIVLEINEQESIQNFDKFRDLAERYRSQGFQFALDDTGSGYSGFEQMIELSPEYIKMDRSMVAGVDQNSTKQNVLIALLTLAEQMGSRVIGEGLGRLEELEMLQKLGIHFGQGWLFGQPTPMSARSPLQSSD